MMVEMDGIVEEVFQGNVAPRSRESIGRAQVCEQLFATEAWQHDKSGARSHESPDRHQAADHDVRADRKLREAKGTYRVPLPREQILHDNPLTRPDLRHLVCPERRKQQIEKQCFLFRIETRSGIGELSDERGGTGVPWIVVEKPLEEAYAFVGCLPLSRLERPFGVPEDGRGSRLVPADVRGERKGGEAAVEPPQSLLPGQTAGGQAAAASARTRTLASTGKRGRHELARSQQAFEPLAVEDGDHPFLCPDQPFLLPAAQDADRRLQGTPYHVRNVLPGKM
jgi:hypothetical protein